MSKEYAGVILRVNPGSLAEELEILPGDKNIEINEINHTENNRKRKVRRK